MADVIRFDHDDILRKFHNGLTDQQISEICELTSKGKSVWVVTEEDGFTAFDYHVYGDGGQLTSGSHGEFMEFQANGFEIKD